MATAMLTARMAMRLPGRTIPRSVDVPRRERGQRDRERHVDLLPRVEQELGLGGDDLSPRDDDHAGGAPRELLARAAIHTELREPAPAGERARDAADVLEDQPPQRARHARRLSHPLGLRALDGEL